MADQHDDRTRGSLDPEAADDDRHTPDRSPSAAREADEFDALGPDGDEARPDRLERRASRASLRRAMEDAALAAAVHAAVNAKRVGDGEQERAETSGDGDRRGRSAPPRTSARRVGDIRAAAREGASDASPPVFDARDARPALGAARAADEEAGRNDDGAPQDAPTPAARGDRTPPPPAERKNQALAKVDTAKLPGRPAPDVTLVDEEAFEAARIAREARMREIRKELRRRRRFRAIGMVLRFALFVLIPTAFVGWYYFEEATDMYVSDSSMIFKSGSNQPTGGGLFAAAMGSSPTDSVALQEYILSRDILKRLDAEHGIISHFQSEEIDWWHRLPADASFDDAYSYYAGGFILPGKVSVSYDIAEGIVRLEMIAATPEKAKEFNDAIISYGEELVNSLNDRSRNEGVRAADEKVAEAQEGLRAAQRKVADVQEQLSIFSVESEAGALQGRIVALEGEIDAILAQIANLKTITSNPNDSRFIPLRTQLEIKTEQLRDLRGRLTGGSKTTQQEGPSMARLGAELELARLDQMAANMMYTSALTSRESALALAAEQSLFLEVVTKPTLPDEATKPERLQNTGLVFLILFGGYIIGLLTVSLIREQAAI